jgi:hypothetical protein
MATLTGSRTSAGINYYTWDAVDVNLSTTGFAAGTTWSFRLQATGYSGSDQIGYDVALKHAAPDTTECFHWTGITPSGSPLSLITYGPTVVGSGIEWTSTSGATGCTDFTRITFSIHTYKYPGTDTVTWNWEVDYTPATISAICVYGVSKQQPATALVQATYPLLDDIGLIEEGPWALPFILAHVGLGIDIDTLCSAPPPLDSAITAADWTTTAPSPFQSRADAKLWNKFQINLWQKFCK